MQRRRLVQIAGLGAIGLWVWGAPRLSGLWPAELSFTPIASAPPFRRLDQTGPASALNAVTAGLDQSAAPAAINPCDHLWGGAATGIAIFSDANCPNCPEMDANVTAEARAAGWEVHHKVLPLLGPSSELAARAALAATLQTDDAGFRTALMSARGRPTIPMIRAFATAHRIDLDQLTTDMQRPVVSQQIATNLALARALGLIGTPATVIGHTVILGILPRTTIRRIIALEDTMRPPCS